MVEVDVTKLKDRRAYYAAQVEFLDSLLNGTLSAKQRREAERERMACAVKASTTPPSPHIDRR